MPTSHEDLFGCDTLVATATGTADRSVIFAKNSDRLPDECQHLRVYPARDWERGAAVRCQYVTLPQVRGMFAGDHSRTGHGKATGRRAGAELVDPADARGPGAARGGGPGVLRDRGGLEDPGGDGALTPEYGA